MNPALHRLLYCTGTIGAVLAAGCTAVDGAESPRPPDVPDPLVPTTVRPEARVETAPVPNSGDAADDPAVWIHPQNPGLSLVLGTDKQGGLHAYNMDGSEHQAIATGAQPNNVDVLYGFSLRGRAQDLAVAGVHGDEGTGLKVWVIDPASRRLSDVTNGGVIRALGGRAPYGTCSYRSAQASRFYVFVTDGDGQVEEYEVADAGDGSVGARKVRAFRLGSVAEGCVADDELGFLYLAEEEVGIWKFAAEPDGGAVGTLVARVGENGLTADVEGLAIYAAAGQGRGYLIASSQGNDTFKVYERAGENRYVLTIDPTDGRIDDVSDTDGIAVTSCPTSPQFAQGVFIVQDGTNAGGHQNFKLYAWPDIAGTNLLIHTACPARAAAR